MLTALATPKLQTFGLEQVPYGVGVWGAGDLGNHRACVYVAEPVGVVWVRIPWRRRDTAPQEKNVVVIEAATGKRINNVCCAKINREFGDLIFEPAAGPGEYYVYYLPCKIVGN